MSKFDDFVTEVKTGIADIAKTQIKDFVAQATSDGQAFLEALKADLQTWTKQLAAGTLTRKDFAFLVRGKQDLAKMNALTEAGLATIRIDQIRSAVIDLIIAAAFKMI